MDSLRSRRGDIDGLATRLRSWLDAPSNEHANFTAKAEQECTTYQDALSDSTRRELGQTLKDEAAKSGVCNGRSTSRMTNSTTCLRSSRKWTSSARIQSAPQSSPRRRTRSPPHLRCTRTPLTPPSSSCAGFRLARMRRRPRRPKRVVKISLITFFIPGGVIVVNSYRRRTSLCRPPIPRRSISIRTLTWRHTTMAEARKIGNPSPNPMKW